MALRGKIEADASQALGALRQRIVNVHVDGNRVAWRVLPLRNPDEKTLGSIARRAQLPTLSSKERGWLDGLTSSAAAAVRDVKPLVGARRFFSGSSRKATGSAAGEYLTRVRAEGLAVDVPGLLDALLRHHTAERSDIPLHHAMEEWVGLRSLIRDLGADPQVSPVSVLGPLTASIESINAAVRREESLQADARAAGQKVRESEVSKILSDMPVERLKNATRDRLRIGPLIEGGITTVQAVLDRGAALEFLPGIGATTATRIRGAAQTLRQTTHDEMPVRVDIKSRTPEATELLHRLRDWDALRRIKGATTDLALTHALTPLANGLDRDVTHLVVTAGDRTPEQFYDAVQSVNQRAAQVSFAASDPSDRDPWEDFLTRPADYFALLSELGFITEDDEKTHGDLPDDIVDAVRKLELNTQHLTASLRGYQSFAARFALTQRKVIIGDEMGLGKTVEALAVLAHLKAKGSHHALVICPAAVVTNWLREVQSKSALRPHRVHGHGRDSALRNWTRNGGVAVTTFETLAWASESIGSVDIGCIVVDEAHYIKNPAALRSQRVSDLIDRSDRAILLTGTPLENRIDEFRNLVSYLRPDLLLDANELAPRRFRRQVAPAYLRRNQEDVLTELPELVEVDEWLPMSSKDEQAYREAVGAGNFMAMRQAAMANGIDSEKMRRLIEIVEEAEDNGRRVIVFSHFRKVLDEIAQVLPGEVFGPLTGSVPAAARQTMVDRFSSAGHGAVLVSQIVAGGVGLNVQAASVVVICEPQLKPTIEWQAIARARRMGQLQTVQVHRLLSEEGVDQRITDLLARKKELFDDFARVSETAESAPEAYDVTEAELAREVVAAERERLFKRPTAESREEEAV
ncbi:DEAD/DEAH box helicase [Aeromicrobium camelliae]|uniref:DEAD/DEAH box helicase n=1 Tax=Aeromicrobium camelliae TaxID=1538144 RepID=UPI001AA057FD|nr:DEAD/DEAH box helicase [Aeromicrobium camelliae]